MSGSIEFIDINEIIRSIKSKNKFMPKEEVKDLIYQTVMSGVSFKKETIQTTTTQYYNKFTESKESRYYFKCPMCDSRVRKIYALISGEVGCRKCCKIKSKTKINSQADRIIKIQKYMSDLLSGKKLSSRKKRQLTKFIIDHYNSLDDKYKFAYNTFVFKEIQNWCLDRLIDKEKSSDYKEAVKDMLDILKDSKNILVKTGLAKTKKKDLQI